MGRRKAAETLEETGARYRRAEREAKGTILDEFCRLHGYERKYAIKLLSRRRKKAKAAGQRGPKARYGGEEAQALRAIWLAADQPCSKRLKALLPLWLPHHEKARGALAEAARERLLGMSASTMDRLLRPWRVQAKRRRPAQPGRLLRTQIPVRARWEASENTPGWIEADTVSHGGRSTQGDYVWSLTLTDIHTGWTEMRAVWNRGAQGVLAAVAQVEAALFFPILGFDSDNGGEFLNAHLIAHFARPEGRKVKQTRSRPCLSNDNAHVEQKQWTHVRQLLGYDRLDDPGLVALANALYEPWCLLKNFFMPTMKLQKSWREGAKIRRVYESEPKTPCQRLLEWGGLESSARERLLALRDSLDPLDLQRQVQERLGPILDWVRRRRAETPAMPSAAETSSLSQEGCPMSEGTPARNAAQEKGRALQGPAHRSTPPRRSGRSPAEPYPPGG